MCLHESAMIHHNNKKTKSANSISKPKYILLTCGDSSSISIFFLHPLGFNIAGETMDVVEMVVQLSSLLHDDKKMKPGLLMKVIAEQ